MFMNIARYSFRVIRSIAILFGALILIFSLIIIIQTPKPNEYGGMPLWISLPYIGFGLLLILPYKKIQNKWVFYVIYLIFLFYIVALLNLFIGASKIPSLYFDTYKIEPISMIIFIFHLINFWSYMRITSHNRLSYISFCVLGLVFFIALLWLHFAPASFDAPYHFSWKPEYGTGLGQIYKDKIQFSFARKEKIPTNELGKIEILYETIPLETQFKGRYIFFNLRIHYSGKDYLVRVKGKRYWIRQFKNWDVIKIQP